MKKKVLVLYGGLSEEREISIKSGKAVSKALEKKGFTVLEYDFNGKLEEIISSFSPDIVFIALHGRFGEDGTVQGALEILGIPYTGSDVLTSSVCMNKLFTKFILQSINIPTPKYVSIKKDKSISYDKVCEYLNSKKVVVKPNDQGSTVGLSIVSNESEYLVALEKAFKLSSVVLLEEYLKGTEITVSVIGNYPDYKILPIIEIIPAHEYYDYESKYIPGMSIHKIPANISKNAENKAIEFANTIAKTLNLRDFARIDMIVKDETPYVLEINTIPGFTETSLVPDAAKAIGISFEDLVELIIREALKRGQ